MMKKLTILTALMIFSCLGLAQTTIDIKTFENNFNDNNKQLVWRQGIDSLQLNRGNAKFYLGKGNLTLFDFGTGRPCAAYFDGPVHYTYNPPNDIERYQLNKFIGQDSASWEFDTLFCYFSIDFSRYIDTNTMTKETVSKEAWERHEAAADDIFDHISIYPPNRILCDMLSDNAGMFFSADFRAAEFEHLIYVEDPFQDDWCRLYKLTRTVGAKTYDVYAGYSPDNVLPSNRGFMPIDITHYKISSTLDGKGNMLSNCRISYNPLTSGNRFLYFNWYYKNKPIAALNSSGDTLQIVHKKDECGLGIVLNQPLVTGDSDFVDIVFDCNSLINKWGVFSFGGRTYWYPKNPFWDRSTFELNYDYPEDYEIISCGERTGLKQENGRIKSNWVGDIPVEYFSFNYGIFDSRKIAQADLPEINVYMAKNIPHEELATLFNSIGELSIKDAFGAVSTDIKSSLMFFTNLLGPCPFKTIKAVEATGASGQGSPGLIHYTWLTFQFEGASGGDSRFRAHEVSHQWWGHMIDYESYRDVWITEGLAEYSGFLYYQPLAENHKAYESILKDWRMDVIDGTNHNSIGNEAGPLVLGYRLNSSKSDDYSTVIYEKGAYIFHMIRYLMYDYKNGSDAAFKRFLNDMLLEFSHKPVTTERLKALLESYLQTDMTWFFDQYVYGIDIPTYTFAYDTEKNAEGKYEVTCHVKQENVPATFKMMVPITLLFGDDQYAHLKIWVDKPENEIKLPPLPIKPKSIDFNTYDAVLCKVKE